MPQQNSCVVLLPYSTESEDSKAMKDILSETSFLMVVETKLFEGDSSLEGLNPTEFSIICREENIKRMVSSEKRTYLSCMFRKYDHDASGRIDTIVVEGYGRASYKIERNFFDNFYDVWYVTPILRILTVDARFGRKFVHCPISVPKQVKPSTMNKTLSTQHLVQILEMLALEEHPVINRSMLFRMLAIVEWFQVGFRSGKEYNKHIEAFEKAIENPEENMNKFEKLVSKVDMIVLETSAIMALCALCLKQNEDLQNITRKFIRNLIFILTNNDTLSKTISDNPDLLVLPDITYDFSFIWISANTMINRMILVKQTHVSPYKILDMLDSLVRFLNTESKDIEVPLFDINDIEL